MTDTATPLGREGRLPLASPPMEREMTDSECVWPYGKQINVKGRGLLTTEDAVDGGKRVRAWDINGTLIWVTRDRGGEWVVLEVNP